MQTVIRVEKLSKTFTLWEAIRGFQFQQTCALMVLIIVTVSLLDFLSQRLRKHFI